VEAFGYIQAGSVILGAVQAPSRGKALEAFTQVHIAEIHVALGIYRRDVAVEIEGKRHS
tara:strand:- start:375 stop:551 length:177 start_codon:yes stop_codon:yes gene_type:complete